MGTHFEDFLTPKERLEMSKVNTLIRSKESTQVLLKAVDFLRLQTKDDLQSFPLRTWSIVSGMHVRDLRDAMSVLHDEGHLSHYAWILSQIEMFIEDDVLQENTADDNIFIVFYNYVHEVVFRGDTGKEDPAYRYAVSFVGPNDISMIDLDLMFIRDISIRLNHRLVDYISDTQVPIFNDITPDIYLLTRAMRDVFLKYMDLELMENALVETENAYGINDMPIDAVGIFFEPFSMPLARGMLMYGDVKYYKNYLERYLNHAPLSYVQDMYDRNVINGDEEELDTMLMGIIAMAGCHNLLYKNVSTLNKDVMLL